MLLLLLLFMIRRWLCSQISKVAVAQAVELIKSIARPEIGLVVNDIDAQAIIVYGVRCSSSSDDFNADEEIVDSRPMTSDYHAVIRIDLRYNLWL